MPLAHLHPLPLEEPDRSTGCPVRSEAAGAGSRDLTCDKAMRENLTGKADKVFRASEKLPLALTLKMISVFLMLASVDYSLISVTQAEGLPRSLSK